MPELKPLPEKEPEEEELEEEEEEEEPEPERGIPQEVLDKVYAEIAEIERKTKLSEEILLEAKATKEQADLLKENAEKIRAEAQEESGRTIEQAKQIMADAEQFMTDTKKQAEQVLEDARKEGYELGHKEGVEQGIKDGREHIEQELADIVRQANDKAQKTINDAKEQTSEYFIRAEDDIIKVLMMAIEKILPQHFLDVPQVILPVVHESIKYVRDQKEIKIHVEPDSYDLILMARNEFQSMLTDGTAIIEVVSDEALSPGDCIIETPNGAVDARLSTQINLMKSAIKSVMNKQS